MGNCVDREQKQDTFNLDVGKNKKDEIQPTEEENNYCRKIS